jgi:hypothetical protein
MITPKNWLRQNKPGWEFWLATPVPLGCFLLVGYYFYEFTRPNQADLILLFIVPVIALITFGCLFLQYKLGQRSIAANWVSVIVVPLGYYLILDNLLQAILPGPDTTLTVSGSNYTYTDTDKMSEHFHNWPAILFIFIALAYIVSAIRLLRNKRQQHPARP